MIQCTECMVMKPKYCRGLCSACYDRQSRSKGTCQHCGGDTCRPKYKSCIDCLNTIDKPRLGTTTSDEARKNIGESHKGLLSGEKHWNRKGGITSENAMIRNSWTYKEWRMSVYKRDGWECRLCGQLGGDLECHHILRFADYPNKRFDINNGITLCKDCHNQTKGQEEKFEEELFLLVSLP